MTEDFPPELENACKNFESAMINAEKIIAPLFESERSQLVRTATALETAKLDLVSVYAINSFYWAYLIMQGIDPKKHTIKTEIDRVRAYMSKIEEITNKKNAPKLAKETAKRFVRNALFDADAKNKNDSSAVNETKSDEKTSKNQSKRKPGTEKHKSKKPKLF